MQIVVNVFILIGSRGGLFAFYTCDCVLFDVTRYILRKLNEYNILLYKESSLFAHHERAGNGHRSLFENLPDSVAKVERISRGNSLSKSIHSSDAFLILFVLSVFR